MSVQRHLKALGTFGYQATAAGNERYLSAVPHTLGYLADVFRRYAPLRPPANAPVPQPPGARPGAREVEGAHGAPRRERRGAMGSPQADAGGLGRSPI